MNWFKLLRHDVIRGLLRCRYLLSILIFSIPCFTFASVLHRTEIQGSLMDYMLFLFQGKEPIIRSSISEQIDLPIFWLLVTVGCLILNLDYLLKDMTTAGQQVIIRSKCRKSWYLSKCVWNIGSCMLYFLIAGVTCALFAVITGSSLSFQNSPELTFTLFGFAVDKEMSIDPIYALLASWILPFLTITALSMFQMALCLFIKPVTSFVICIGLLILSIYWNSPFALGNGAMTIRSGFIANSGISPAASVLLAIVIIVISILVGTIRFQYTDILSLEE